MDIAIHERPLPEESELCSSVAVELDCPLELAGWRNLTWLLMHRIGRKGGTKGEYPESSLYSYPGLKDYFQSHGSHITLASKTKSNLAHKNRIHFPVDFQGCCVGNGLNFQLYDVERSCWIDVQDGQQSLKDYCTPSLPQGLYSGLQYAVDNSDHSQNFVIANQESCPKGLSLQEFLSFGTLRADGERVQWLNIKRELAVSNLNFNTPEVLILICQAVWQAGIPIDCVARNAHLDVTNANFAEELLMEIDIKLASIHGNWKSDHAMAVLIVLTLRVLSLTSSEEIVRHTIGILRRIRTATKQWTRMIGNMLPDAKGSEQASSLSTSLLKAALLGKMTYDVEDQYVEDVVCTDDDLSTWVECSICVRQNIPGSCDQWSQALRSLVLYDRRFSQTLLPSWLQRIAIGPTLGIEHALARVLPDFSSFTGFWDRSNSPNDRWLVTEAFSAEEQSSSQIHYNVLEGAVLIDGQGLGRLPPNYSSDGSYIRLFGSQVLSVMPARAPGMQYRTSQPIEGHFIYFAMRNGQLIIRSKKDSVMMELIPAENFKNDLPSLFVNRYVHWLNLSNRVIHFRPLNKVWKDDESAWTLQYRENESILMRGSQRLVARYSDAHNSVMEVFEALESTEHVHVINTEDEELLEVELPRYALHFELLKSGEFLCRELGKIVDSNQTLGTLIGLKSRLVLCGQDALARKHDRVVLIPEGKVSWTRNESRLIIEVKVSGCSPQLVQFEVDPILQRLKGKSDCHSMAFQAFLHAVTSHYLPDPFTERTGTEEAIALLRQQSMNPSKPLDDRSIKWLVSISKLTPKYKSHPAHRKMMQEVYWDPILSCLSQHEDFVVLAQHIATEGNRFSIFHPETEKARSPLTGRGNFLTDRARIKNSSFRYSEQREYGIARGHELVYASRDRCSSAIRSNRTYEMARLVESRSRTLQVSSDLFKDLRKYGKMSGLDTTFKPSGSLSDLLSISYDQTWGSLHRYFRYVDPKKGIYEVLFLVGVVAYGQNIKDLTPLKTLVAFVYNNDLRAVKFPSQVRHLQLSKGTNMKRARVEAIVAAHVVPFRRRRNMADARLAEERAYKEDVPDQYRIVAQHYLDQWPSIKPDAPEESLASKVRLSPVQKDVSKYFSLLTSNELYREYCQAVQPILNQIYQAPASGQYSNSHWYIEKSVVETALSPALPSLSTILPANEAPKHRYRLCRPRKESRRIMAIIQGLKLFWMASTFKTIMRECEVNIGNYSRRALRHCPAIKRQ